MEDDQAKEEKGNQERGLKEAEKQERGEWGALDVLDFCLEHQRGRTC